MIRLNLMNAPSMARHPIQNERMPGCYINAPGEQCEGWEQKPLHGVFKVRRDGGATIYSDIVTRRKQLVYIHTEVILDGNIFLTIAYPWEDIIPILPTQMNSQY